MKLLNSVALILSSLWIGGTSELQLCQFGQTTTHQTNINMNSTAISGSISMCSCRIQLNNDVKITMFPDLNIPGCRTRVSVSDSSFVFSCLNEKIFSPYHADKKAGDVLWLFVKTTDKSLPMSGNLQVKTNKTAEQFSLECFYPNRNTSATTTTPTTSNSTHEIHKPMPSKTPDANVSLSESLSVSRSGSTAPNVSLTVDNERGFKVAAVAGGIAGSLLLILIVVLAVVCFRRRARQPHLPVNGGQRSVIQEYENQLDTGVAGEMKTRKKQMDVHIENDLYVSADIDIDNQPYAVVDKSNKYRDQLVVDLNHSESPAPVVNKKQEPEDKDVTHRVSLSGDVSALVDKGQGPLGLETTHMIASSGDVYAIVDRKPVADPNDQ